MDENGAVAVIGALASQVQSLGTLKLSGNRLGAQGSQRLCSLVSQGPAALQLLAMEECQASLDSLGTAIASAASKMRSEHGGADGLISLTSLDVSGNQWSPALVNGIGGGSIPAFTVRLYEFALRPGSLGACERFLQELKALTHLRLANTAIQTDMLQ
eukprot:scaffold358149_cov46-Prasinocladus_malaysianus.AAC.1